MGKQSEDIKYIKNLVKVQKSTKMHVSVMCHMDDLTQKELLYLQKKYNGIFYLLKIQTNQYIYGNICIFSKVTNIT